jgi:hypothetical protein
VEDFGWLPRGVFTEDQANRVLEDTFFTYWKPLEDQLSADTRLAHYTTAATAKSIISAKPDERSIWLRNATEMNDFSEVEFGQRCLMAALGDDAICAALKTACDAVHPELLHKAAAAMDAEVQRIKSETYLFSLSLHSGEELGRGRLSMWRAYGGNNSVCLLFDPKPFVTPQQVYSVFVSPMSYEGPAYLLGLLKHLATKIAEHRHALAQIAPDKVLATLKFSLDAGVLTTKHPAFKEEQEWRIIYRPSIDARPALPSRIVCLDGVVQKVHFIPMQNVPDRGVNGAELDEILQRIIIGPTDNPQLVKEAFVSLLRDANVPEPEARVVTSEVPLRR